MYPQTLRNAELAVLEALSRNPGDRVLRFEQGWLPEDITQCCANLPSLPGTAHTYGYFSAISGKGYNAQEERYSQEPRYRKLDMLVVPSTIEPALVASLEWLCKEAGTDFYYERLTVKHEERHVLLDDSRDSAFVRSCSDAGVSMRWNCYKLNEDTKTRELEDSAYMPGRLLDKALMSADVTGRSYAIVGPADEGNKILLVRGDGLGFSWVEVATRETSFVFDAALLLNGWEDARL